MKNNKWATPPKETSPLFFSGVCRSGKDFSADRDQDTCQGREGEV